VAGVVVAGGAGHTGAATGGQTSASGEAATGAGCGGALAQAPRSSAVASAGPIPDNGAARNLEEKGLGWVFLEVGLALAIVVLIVWWTLPRKPRGQEDDKPK
jgi:hypothetical protein